jgi:stage II sporulation protein D
VAARNKLISLALLAGLASCMISCSGMPFLVPHPPGESGRKADTAAVVPGKEPRKDVTLPGVAAAGVDAIDFAAAFGADTGVSGAEWPVFQEQTEEKPPVVSAPPYVPFLPGKMIRVALRQGISRAVLHASGTVEVHSSSLSPPARCKGRLSVEKKGPGKITIAVNGGVPHDVVLPCTLMAASQSNLFDLGNERYRGSFIISGETTLSLVNFIAVEDYLRGVLPIEMGKRGMEEIEALKAQAVAARTYAYRRIAVNAAQPFDVLSTVADQVYRGADVETAECSYAVNATGDLVLWWGDSLADVYYHSTCGGRTADASEVWGASRREYLCSKSDIAPDGQAYCSSAPAFNWEESWNAAELSNILCTRARQTFPDARFGGTLRTLKVEERFRCGRVKRCLIAGTDGKFECGGDKLRFVLRRKSAAGEILRSANFTVEKNGPDVFTLRGRGFGHGIGMCQMGALGRARKGQNFEQILRAYYNPAYIVRIQYTATAR